MSRICLIGEVIVDVTLTSTSTENKMRLGGTIHAARALWAIGVEYDLLFIAPDYLRNQIENYAKSHGATNVIQIGVVTGAPNIVLIQEVKEIGNQGYELLLREDYSCTFVDSWQEALQDDQITDLCVFSGNYDFEALMLALSASSARVHVDLSNGNFRVADLAVANGQIKTLITSTSSDIFLIESEKNVGRLKSICFPYATSVLLKENRGGARFFDSTNEEPLLIGAQLRPIVHSVGVGDCFDVIFVALQSSKSTYAALCYAAWISAEYASTTWVDDFKRECGRILSSSESIVVGIRGVSLPWEQRKDFQIYIAAPDFDYVNTEYIDQIVGALNYHNFSPRLPVRENGQVNNTTSPSNRRTIFYSDMRLIDECDLLVAVMLFDDPGTLIEIGIAASKNIPVLVYDPYKKANNLVLMELPKCVTSDADEIIMNVFDIASKSIGKEYSGGK